MARWSQTAVGTAGVDVGIHSSPSAPTASASVVRASGAGPTAASKAAAWASERTFARCYRLSILSGTTLSDNVFNTAPIHPSPMGYMRG